MADTTQGGLKTDETYPASDMLPKQAGALTFALGQALRYRS